MKKILFLILLFNLSISCMDNSKSELHKKHESEKAENATAQNINSLIQKLRDIENKYGSGSTLERETETNDTSKGSADIAKTFREISREETDYQYVSHFEKEKAYKYLSNKENFYKLTSYMPKDVSSIIYQYLGLFELQQTNTEKLWFSNSHNSYFSPNGKYLATGYKNNRVLLRKLAVNNREYNKSASLKLDNINLKNSVFHLTFSNDNKYLALDDFSSLSIWSIDDNNGCNSCLPFLCVDSAILQKIYEVKTGGESISSMEFHPSTNILVFCTQKGLIFLLDFIRNDLKKIFEVDTSKYYFKDMLFTEAKFSHDAKILFIKPDCTKTEIIKCDLENIKTNNISLDKLAHANSILPFTRYFEFSSDDEHDTYDTLGGINEILPSKTNNDLIVYTQNGIYNSRLIKFNTENNDIKELFLGNKAISSYKFSPNNLFLIVVMNSTENLQLGHGHNLAVGTPTEILIITPNSMEKLAKFVINLDGVQDFTFINNGEYLACIGEYAKKINYYKTSLIDKKN